MERVPDCRETLRPEPRRVASPNLDPGSVDRRRGAPREIITPPPGEDVRQVGLSARPGLLLGRFSLNTEAEGVCRPDRVRRWSCSAKPEKPG
jgi:hypothetical protein